MAAIILIPIVVDYTALPMGWELPKLYFWQMFGIFFSLAAGGWLILRKKTTKTNGVRIAPLFTPIALILLISVSSVTSVYLRDLTPSHSPLYKLFNFEYGNLAIFGNPFRDFGLISVIILISLGVAVRNLVTKRTIKYLEVAFIASSVLQSLIAIYQFLGLVNSPVLVRQGLYVGGTFGQPNFLTGHILVGFVLVSKWVTQFSGWKRAFLVTIAVLMIAAIVSSFSIWSYFVAGLAIILITLYEYLGVKKFVRTLYIGAAVIGVLAVPFVFVLLKIAPVYAHRINIWSEILRIYTGDPTKLIFGSGFDTLQEVLRGSSIFRHSYVDRAHNFALDVFASTGLTGIFGVILLVKRVSRNFRHSLKSREFAYMLIALLVWVARSLVHTSSVVNLADMVVLVAVLFSLSNFNKHP
ncbi:MAG: O-antigen ligase family protein [Candidatus Dojkabacteria bacterium]